MINSLVEEFYLPLYRYAYRLTGCAATAEDLTQDTFCQAQQKVHQLRDTTKRKSWLFRILRNNYLLRIRTEKQEQRISLEAVGEIAERLTEPLPEVEPEQLQEVLNELPELFRSTIILYYFENFTYRDIAEQMDLPIGTVMSRLARAKSFLRERLTSRFPEVVTEAPKQSREGE